MKNRFLIVMAALFMANVNVVLGQERTAFTKISLPANYLWMESTMRSNPDMVKMEFIPDHFELNHVESLDSDVIGTWENLNYYSSSEYRKFILNCFAITTKGKLNQFEATSFSTIYNISLYKNKNHSLLDSFSISTRNNCIYINDPKSGEEILLAKYIVGQDYLILKFENGSKFFYKKKNFQ